MVISTLADGITRGVDSIADSVSGVFMEPVIRIGVTGLARAGKTVFITSLVANLMDRARMTGLAAASEGRIVTAFLQPQPDDTVPRFEFESHLAALSGPDPVWPESTRSISELRLSIRVQPAGLFAGFQGPRTVHLDIVDYPGEWLLDLGLMDKSYDAWCEQTLARVRSRPEHAKKFIALLEGANTADKLVETEAKTLAAAYTDYLSHAQDAGHSDGTPGRFLLPGDLAGSPVLTFAPLPEGAAPRGSLRREMERRYEAYKSQVVRPFFRDHFARIDRQIVLVDALGAIHQGPQAVEDLRLSMSDILSAFRPGRNAFLSRLLRGRRVEKILFAATKADHLHHTQHRRLTAIMEALVRSAKDRADFAGAETAAMSIASLRATIEQSMPHGGETLDCVSGTLLDSNKHAAFYPGELPDDPAHLLAPARARAEAWLDGDYKIMRFAPPRLKLKPGEGPPHIRLDRAAQFLIGDRL